MLVALVPPLLLTLLLTQTSNAVLEPAPLCSPQWLPFGQRCFAFFPVWSSWSTANSMCSQTGGNLVSLNTPEEREFIRQLSHTHSAAPVWLGGYLVQQDESWFWSDSSPFRINRWTNQMRGKTAVGGVCLEIDPKSGELLSTSCSELRFYICSMKAHSRSPVGRKVIEPGLVPSASLFVIMWDQSQSLASEILRWSSFLSGLRSGQLTPRCYAHFLQQEALYLRSVSSTLQALIGRVQEEDDVSSLLLVTLQLYGNRNQSLPPPLPPQWLQFSLRSFHSVVLEEPVYWLVALAARACLRGFLSEELPPSASFFQQWSRDGLQEVAWTHRFKVLMEKYQHKMDVFKTINIFREHMMNQKSFYKAADCDDED